MAYLATYGGPRSERRFSETADVSLWSPLRQNGLFGPVRRCIRFEHWYVDTERSGSVADDITRA
jgi:hypothetical protein